MEDTRRLRIGLIYFIVLIALTAVRMINALGFGKGWTSNESDINYTLITQILCMGVLPFTLYVLLILRKENKKVVELFKDFRYQMPSVKVIVLSFVAGFIFYYATIGISSIWSGLLKLIGFTNISDPGTIFTKPGDLILWIFIIGVLPGVFEEFTHRGLITANYEKSSEEEGVLISALLFALMHQNIRQFGYALAGGVVLGYFLTKSKSIIPPMILHFTNNTLNTVIDYSSQTNGVIGRLFDNYLNIFDNYLMSLLLIFSFVMAFGALFFILIEIDKSTAKKHNTETTWNKGFKWSNLKLNRNDTFLYAAIILGVITTAFSLIWGIIR